MKGRSTTVSSEKATDVQRRILEKIREVASYAEEIPGVVILHEVKDFRVIYMSPLGLKMLGKKWEDVKGLSGVEYHERFFHPEFAEYVAPKIIRLIEENSRETISFFQQVRTGPSGGWDWYMSMLRILLRDDDDEPVLTISIAMKIDPTHYFTAKMGRVFQENRFLRENHERFSSLTKREKEVLRLLATGKSCAAIARQLHISPTTAETHRKKIRHKLDAKTNFDLTRYAQAFDLI